MAQAPIMPVATDALIADTTHLSAEEFGAYCLILFATWRNNGKPLPDNDLFLSRVCRVSLNQFKAKIKPMLLGFFDISDGYLHQKRLEREWVRVKKIRAIRRAAGKLGGRPKTLIHHETGKANGLAELKQNESTQTQTHIKEIPNGISKRATKRTMEAEFDEFYGCYPKHVAPDRARVAFARARRKAGQADLVAAARRYAESVVGTEERYISAPASWLNGGRWLDEPTKPQGGLFAEPAFPAEVIQLMPDGTPQEKLWVSRVLRWKEDWHSWMADIYDSPPPDDPATKVPEAVLCALGLHEHEG